MYYGKMECRRCGMPAIEAVACSDACAKRCYVTPTQRPAYEAIERHPLVKSPLDEAIEWVRRKTERLKNRWKARLQTASGDIHECEARFREGQSILQGLWIIRAKRRRAKK